MNKHYATKKSVEALDQVLIRVQSPKIKGTTTNKKIIPKFSADKNGVPFVVLATNAAYITILDLAKSLAYKVHQNNIFHYPNGKFPASFLKKYDLTGITELRPDFVPQTKGDSNFLNPPLDGKASTKAHNGDNNKDDSLPYSTFDLSSRGPPVSKGPPPIRPTYLPYEPTTVYDPTSTL